MARKTAYTFWDSPPKAAMVCNEGAWTDDDDYKLGGYFSASMDADTWVALDTTANFTVKKATASTDLIIGKLESEPQGEHTASGRTGNVQLFGDYVLECEIDTASDAIAPGASVVFSGAGGSYSEGVWKKSVGTTLTVTGSADATSSFYNGTVALVSTSASGSIASGTVIPVLFGHNRVVETVAIVVDGA